MHVRAATLARLSLARVAFPKPARSLPTISAALEEQKSLGRRAPTDGEHGDEPTSAVRRRRARLAARRARAPPRSPHPLPALPSRSTA